MERAETHANEGLICQKHLKVDGRLCQTPWVQPARPHFEYDGVMYSFAGIMFCARVSPFTQGSQISLADPGSASVKPKHLDKKQKLSLSSSQPARHFSPYICLVPTVLDGCFIYIMSKTQMKDWCLFIIHPGVRVPGKHNAPHNICNICY